MLPDHPELESVLLEGEGTLRIPIVTSEGTSKSIIEILDDAGLKRVRKAVGPPQRVLGQGREEPAPSEWRDALDKLRSRRLERELPKRLQELGVPSSLLKYRWQHELNTIERIRSCDALTAHYRWKGKAYSVPVPVSWTNRRPNHAAFRVSS